MKTFMIVLAFRSATICCVAGSVFLMYHSKEGWGWLIFLGAITSAGSLTLKD